MIDGHRVELDSNENILPRDLRSSALSQKYAACLILMMDLFASQHRRQPIAVSQEAIADRDVAVKKIKTLEEEIADLRGLHTELTTKYNESQDFVRRLEGSLKKERNQSTSRFTELESAQGKCGELDEEGMAAITELARPATKAGYNMAFQHFGSYLSEVPSDKKWDGLPWPHDDIGVTDQNVPYYIADGPPPPIVVDAEEEGEPGEVNIADS
ncbi:hypothetical protein Dimus_024488 [Dionaea muscipula]